MAHVVWSYNNAAGDTTITSHNHGEHAPSDNNGTLGHHRQVLSDSPIHPMRAIIGYRS